MPSRSHRSLPMSLLAALALAIAAAGPVAAQDDPPPTTSTTSTTAGPTTTSTTTTRPTSTTTTTRPTTTSSTAPTTSSTSSTTSTTSTTTPTGCPPATGSPPGEAPQREFDPLDTNCDGIVDADERTADAVDDMLEQAPDEDPVAPVDAPPEEVPLSDLEVEIVDGAAVGQVIRREITVARADAVRATERVGIAKAAVDSLNAELGRVQRAIARLDTDKQDTIARLARAKVLFEERVASAVVRGNVSEIELLVDSDSALDASRRLVYLESISAADLVSVNEYLASRDTLDAGILLAVDTVADIRRELRVANDELEAALVENAEKKFQLAVFAAGSEIVIEGFAFPVAEPYDFIDSWGYPRMTGSDYEHTHKGTDIMAPFGTELYATERGIITRIGQDILGGMKLWVKGQSGTYYYYAHLQGYVDGIYEGMPVSAGDVVGYVGDTGNARGGPPHLHFQVHPGGGEAVNPYALLKIVSDLSNH